MQINIPTDSHLCEPTLEIYPIELKVEGIPSHTSSKSLVGNPPWKVENIGVNHFPQTDYEEFVFNCNKIILCDEVLGEELLWVRGHGGLPLYYRGDEWNSLLLLLHLSSPAALPAPLPPSPLTRPLGSEAVYYGVVCACVLKRADDDKGGANS